MWTCPIYSTLKVVSVVRLRAQKIAYSFCLTLRAFEQASVKLPVRMSEHLQAAKQTDMPNE